MNIYTYISHAHIYVYIYIYISHACMYSVFLFKEIKMPEHRRRRFLRANVWVCVCVCVRVCACVCARVCTQTFLLVFDMLICIYIYVYAYLRISFPNLFKKLLSPTPPPPNTLSDFSETEAEGELESDAVIKGVLPLFEEPPASPSPPPTTTPTRPTPDLTRRGFCMCLFFVF